MKFTTRILFKVIYYLFISRLPSSHYPGGYLFNRIRVFVIKRFIKIGQKCKIQNHVYIGSEVEIGSFCQINENVKLRNVKIGNHVLIAPGATLIGINHKSDRTDIPITEQGDVLKQIIVEDDVWIATNAIILKGVHLKTGCIIGAGAVVTKDCEPYGIYGGIPAKLIKFRRL